MNDYWRGELNHRINVENHMRTGSPLYPSQIYQDCVVLTPQQELVLGTITPPTSEPVVEIKSREADNE